MPNSKSTFRLIAPKSQGLPQGFPSREPPSQEPLLQEPSREHLQELFGQHSDIIAVATPILPQPVQEITKTSAPVVSAKVSKRNDGKAGWDDASTGLLLSFLEENFAAYRKNKSKFAKLAATKIFPGKSWEQIKNKLSRLVAKYNDNKEKEGQTGREAQAKWKWFERLDALFGTRENHNPRIFGR